MGFGSLATYVILFTVGVSMATGLMFTFRDYFSESSSSIEERQSINQMRMMATMDIHNLTFEKESDNRSILWENETDFEEGIFENTTTDGDSIILTESDGRWFSEIVELKGPVNYSTMLSVFSEETLGGQVEIRMRSAESRESLTGPFLGPDGTNSSYYYEAANSGDEVGISGIHDGDSVFQLEVSMQDGELIGETEVNSIQINFNYIGTLELFIRNTGNEELDDESLDYFIGSERISRDSVLEKEVVDEPGFPNPGIWGPESDLRVKLVTGMINQSTLLTVTNEFAVSESERLEI